MDWLEICGRLLLAGIFFVSGAAKLADGEGSRRTLREFRVPEHLVPAAALALPLTELAIAAGLLTSATAPVAALASGLVLLVFVLGISLALQRGETPECHCFGQLHSRPAGLSTVVRNLALAALSFAVYRANALHIPDWFFERSGSELVNIALGALAALLGLAWWGARSDARTALDRLSEIGPATIGLPLGSDAPEFSVTDFDGTSYARGSILDDQKPTILLFVSPDCQPCQSLLPAVARWQRTLAERMPILVVSIGSELDNRFAAEAARIERMYLEDGSVRQAFRMNITPSAVALHPSGSVASEAALGPLQIETLVRDLSAQHDARSEVAG